MTSSTRQSLTRFRNFLPSGGGVGGTTKMLLAMNVGVWVAWKVVEQSSSPLWFRQVMNQHFVCSNQHCFAQYSFHTMLTSAFSHTDGWHLFTNMVGLFFFGRSLEMAVGSMQLLNIYIASAFAGSALQLYITQRRPREVFLGASGSVYGIMAFEAFRTPWQVVNLWGIVPIPLAALICGLLAYDLQYGNGQYAQGSHLAGAGAGAVAFAMLRASSRV